METKNHPALAVALMYNVSIPLRTVLSDINLPDDIENDWFSGIILKLYLVAILMWTPEIALSSAECLDISIMSVS